MLIFTNLNEYSQFLIVYRNGEMQRLQSTLEIQRDTSNHFSIKLQPLPQMTFCFFGNKYPSGLICSFALKFLFLSHLLTDHKGFAVGLKLYD